MIIETTTADGTPGWKWDKSDFIHTGENAERNAQIQRYYNVVDVEAMYAAQKVRAEKTNS